MTDKEAYEYFKYRLNCGQCGKATTQRKAFLCALESLEKQIPKKPKIVINNGIKYYNCAKCTSNLKYDEKYRCVSYCSVCSQAIDWSEEE